MSIERIRDNIFAEVGYIGANVVCINTGSGAVLIDTPTLKKDIIIWRDFVQNQNPDGIRYIINTHRHYDHIMGNRMLGGVVVMQEQAAKKMFDNDEIVRDHVRTIPGVSDEEKKFVLNETLVAPEITFREDLTFCLDGTTIELRHLGGHCDCSIAIYLKEERILMTGDILTADLHPFKGHACFSEWLEALDKLEDYEINSIIPGHGDVCDKSALNRFVDYMRQLWDMTTELAKVGRSSEEVVRTVHERMFGYYKVDPMRLESAKTVFDQGTMRLYEEIMASAAG